MFRSVLLSGLSVLWFSKTKSNEESGSHVPLCTIKLVPLIDDDSDQPCLQPLTGCSPLKITWHDLEHVEDCIVLRDTVREAVKQNWHVGERFKINLGHEWFLGTISEIEENKGGLNCVRVVYDDKDTDCVSLWDMKRLTESDKSILYPLGAGRHNTATVVSFQFLPEDEKMLRYKPLKGEWGRSSEDVELERIKKCLIQVRGFQVGISTSKTSLLLLGVEIYEFYVFVGH